MFCLVYRSVALPTFNKIQLFEMLHKARLNNSRDGITGCLLFYEGEFIQYLEGNQLKVLNLYDKITTDARHEKIKLLAHGEREFREFNNWEMAYEDFYGDNDQINYLRLLIHSFKENEDSSLQPDPSANAFWKAVRENLGKTLKSHS